VLQDILCTTSCIGNPCGDSRYLFHNTGDAIMSWGEEGYILLIALVGILFILKEVFNDDNDF
jgi:hypothetical protein